MVEQRAVSAHLPERQRQVLARLAATPGPESVQTFRLAAAGMTTAQARGALQALERQGLVRRARSGTTYIFWSLTDAGMAAAGALARLRSPHGDEDAANLTHRRL